MRGIACILVVIFHFNVNQPGGWRYFNLGVAGVDFFFVISGFVIFYSLLKNNNPFDFIVSRFSRLYPAYWTAVCATSALVVLNGGTIPWRDFFVNLTMLQGYFGVDDIDGAYWTLGIELFFYGLAVLPFVFKVIDRIEVFIWVSLLFVYGWHNWGTTFFPSFHDSVSRHVQFLNHAPLFFAGIFFYLIGFDKPTSERYFGILCCFILTCYLHDFYGRTQWVISLHAHVWMLIVFFGAFFFLTAHRLHFLVNRITLFPGTISYSLYLIHQRISTEIVRPVLQHLLPNAPNWEYSAVMLAFSIGAASAITFWIERPAMYFLRACLKRGREKLNSSALKEKSILH